MPPNKPIRRAAALRHGFTLIEALVALVLLGSLASMVFPNMSRWYNAIVARQALSEFTVQARQMPAVAVFTGLDLSFDQIVGEGSVLPPAYRVQLPGGWSVRDAGALRFMRSGLCQAGTAALAQGADRTLWVTGNALCEIDVSMTPPSPSAVR